MDIEPGDILICTVDKIVGTVVFVDIGGTDKKGTIILSEVAAGRIRNLRDYVVPKKIIICKVLRVINDHVELSLRRVREKEKKEALEKSKAEKSFVSILKSVLKEKTSEAIKKIEENGTVPDFLEEAKNDSKDLKKIVGEEDANKILEILNKQKEKTVFLKKEVKIISKNPNGLSIIKGVIPEEKGVKVKYLAAGRYSINSEGENLKKADQKIREVIEKIEKASKKKDIEFSYE
jgi:translation initiation factor 2 alpha subunit (eIF-2alpha)